MRRVVDIFLITIATSLAFKTPTPQRSTIRNFNSDPFRIKGNYRQTCLFDKPRDYNTNRDLTETISDDVLGILVLMTVPLSWGTYTPVVRYLYAIEPPVPGFVFSACYYALAAITTTSLVFWQSQKTVMIDREQEMDQSDNSDFPSIGGIELGSYLFLANCLQVIGLETVQSDRAGFLVQFTTVMVPFAEALFAGNLLSVPVRTWFACLFAFLGLFIMGLDGKAELAGDPISALLTAFSSFSDGDFLILGAALLYTMHVVRLGTYAKQTTPLKLAASKSTWETVLSILLVVVLTSLSPLAGQQSGLIGFGAKTGKEISTFFSSFTDGFASGDIPTSALVPALGAVLWTGKPSISVRNDSFFYGKMILRNLLVLGWVTCAYTIYAQSFGQSRVSPTNANLIYTFQPIFTALFAWVLLGETMGPAGIFGGAIIATSVYIVASSNLAESSSLTLATNEEFVAANSDSNQNGEVTVEKSKKVLDLVDSP